MSTVSSPASHFNLHSFANDLLARSPFNPEAMQVVRTGGVADELSPAAQAEMNEAFAYATPPTEAEIDRQYEAEMARRDAVVASVANPRIELSVATASGKKYAAAVRRGTRTYRLGTFKSETQAWMACQHKAAELRKQFAYLG